MRTWIVELDTGRFGDWVIVQAEAMEEALDSLVPRTPTGRVSKTKRTPAVRRCWESIRTAERRRRAAEDGLPFPVPVHRGGRRR